VVVAEAHLDAGACAQEWGLEVLAKILVAGYTVIEDPVMVVLDYP
jgi:hypothetical protein